MSSAPWPDIRRAFLGERPRPSLQELSRRYAVPYADVLAVAKRERWRFERMSIELRRAAGRPVEEPGKASPAAPPANVLDLAAYRARRGGGR